LTRDQGRVIDPSWLGDELTGGHAGRHRSHRDVAALASGITIARMP
jgi:hypothetical protein